MAFVVQLQLEQSQARIAPTLWQLTCRLAMGAQTAAVRHLQPPPMLLLPLQTLCHRSMTHLLQPHSLQPSRKQRSLLRRQSRLLEVQFIRMMPLVVQYAGAPCLTCNATQMGMGPHQP